MNLYSITYHFGVCIAMVDTASLVFRAALFSRRCRSIADAGLAICMRCVCFS